MFQRRAAVGDSDVEDRKRGWEEIQRNRLLEKELGFSEEKEKNGSSSLSGPVIWPGNLQHRPPKGWEMPTNAKPLKIGVPGRTTFEKFVKVEYGETLNHNKYDGFCILKARTLSPAHEHNLESNSIFWWQTFPFSSSLTAMA
jgi:hypothetical protein